MLTTSLKLGLTSFGGPIAHLGYFYNEYVVRKRWLDERSYTDLVALCQFLPGPASSQVGIGIGIARAGILGGFVAWLGFTLPSVIFLVLFAMLMQTSGLGMSGLLHGLKIVAVAVVAQAVLEMGRKLASDRTRIAIVVGAAGIALLWQTVYTQAGIIVLAGIAGVWLFRGRAEETERRTMHIKIGHKTAAFSLLIFFVLLAGLPLLRNLTTAEWLASASHFYHAGSLVFGGGHVVLPLLETQLVPGYVSQSEFLAGYGAAQAVPGPLFTFAAYLGAMNGGILGALVATASIFLPAFLLVVGTLPFWNELRSMPRIQGMLQGIHPAVVGILLAALYDPVWTSSILSASDFALVTLLFAMLAFWKLPPWVIVLTGALLGNFV